MHKDYNDYYNRYPDEVFYHSEFLYRIETGGHLDLSASVLKGWLQVAVFNNRPLATQIILDRLQLFNQSDLTLPERITLYSLGIE